MNPALPKVMIVSQPKAGTYLLSDIVGRLGFRQTFYHFSMECFDAYDPDRLEEGRRNPDDFRVVEPIQTSIKRVKVCWFTVKWNFAGSKLFSRPI